eukprot:CAMPEP_0194517958 /NCGR_PEP_ID=MMETSP0253-20130528/51270_1 /TAXON_ID=2966 /ORGANISM="Noctiluca scintillans" /LENGTH=1123 /DNA_ID=CAMNT_0039361973 /DNA_START=21 /DNA_END=3388 /DNA_ORIENTATION=-
MGRKKARGQSQKRTAVDPASTPDANVGVPDSAEDPPFPKEAAPSMEDSPSPQEPSYPRDPLSARESPSLRLPPSAETPSSRNSDPLRCSLVEAPALEDSDAPRFGGSDEPVDTLTEAFSEETNEPCAEHHGSNAGHQQLDVDNSATCEAQFVQDVMECHAVESGPVDEGMLASVSKISTGADSISPDGDIAPDHHGEEALPCNVSEDKFSEQKPEAVTRDASVSSLSTREQHESSVVTVSTEVSSQVPVEEAAEESSESTVMLFPSNCADGTVCFSGAVDEARGAPDGHSGEVHDPGQELWIAGDVGSLLQKRKMELQQLRADYESRVRRSQELSDLVRKREEEIQEIPKQLTSALQEVREKLAKHEQVRCRNAMMGEDCLARSHRLVEARDKEIRFLERQMHNLQNSRPREEIPDQALEAKKRQMEALRNDADCQENKISHLSADLKSVLDFMMGINIDACGGPSRYLGPDHFLPKDVRDILKLSEHGQGILSDLVNKYTVYMEKLDGQGSGKVSDTATLDWADIQNSFDGVSISFRDMTASDAARRSDTGKSPLGSALVFDKELDGPGSDSRFGAQSAPSATLADEIRLLRERLTEEMEMVAGVLEESDIGCSTQVRARRELLRVAAWGDQIALKQVLPVIREGACDDGLLGWTVWHAAAAHGQLGVLDVLKDHLEESAVHRDALQQPTVSGWPPLAVACMQGHLTVVRTLLAVSSGVDVRDNRGNTPLVWAAAAEENSVKVPLMRALLDAQADPHARNSSGLTANVDPIAVNGDLMSALGTKEVTSSRRESLNSGRSSQVSSREPLEVIETVGFGKNERSSFLSYTWSMLAPPIRDSVGFMKSEKAKSLAKPSSLEAELGVWSDSVVNYTHAGLVSALNKKRPTDAPSLKDRNAEFLILTCERLLLFHSESWALVQIIELTELREVLLPQQSDSLFVLRTQWTPDLVLDMASRSRFMDELKLATVQLAAHWSRAEPGDQGVPICVETESILSLQSEHRARIGTLAFTEPHKFILLPHAPNSVLLSGQVTFHFGVLDVQRSRRRWQTQFFVLKNGFAGGNRLICCHHPSDTKGLYSVSIESMRKVTPVELPEEEFCFSVEHLGSSGLPSPLTLRAPSGKSR